MAYAIGINRFAYTAILPMMQSEFAMNHSLSGWIASANYLGYFVGAVLLFKHIDNRRIWYRLNAFLGILSMLLMGGTHSAAAWIVIRFVAGMSSAGLFIIGASIIMDRLNELGQIHYKSLIYSGVGAGIALSSLLIMFTQSYFSSSSLWLILGSISTGLAIIAWFGIDDKGIHPEDQNEAYKHSLFDNSLPLLKYVVIAYFLEGFGYIISGTFLVVMADSVLQSSESALITWFLVGVTILIMSFVWLRINKLLGFYDSLLLAFGFQFLGMLTPVLYPGEAAFYISAITFGGSFMAIVQLNMTLSQKYSQAPSNHVIGGVTAIYGFGQIMGPILAGYIAEGTCLLNALILASIVIGLAFMILIIGKLKHSNNNEFI